MIRVLVLLFLLCCAAFPALAKPRQLTYQVYAGGVHVLQARLDLDLTPTKYDARLSATTLGFLSRLVPWQGGFATMGVRKGDQFMPTRHTSVSTWKKTDDRAVYIYGPPGRFKSLKLTVGDKDKTPPTIDKKLTEGTTDILSATLAAMLTAAKTGQCQGKSDIFDSRRRFTLNFVSKDTENLKPTRYSVFSGDAARCTAEVVPAGGAWHKKPRGWLSIQEQGRKKGTLPTLWMGTVDDKLPPVPVRVMLKTNYGVLFMHLSAVD